MESTEIDERDDVELEELGLSRLEPTEAGVVFDCFMLKLERLEGVKFNTQKVNSLSKATKKGGR